MTFHHLRYLTLAAAGLSCLCMTHGSSASAQTPGATAASPGPSNRDEANVTVERVIARGDPNAPLYWITFDYRFSGRDTVFIPNGPGTVPAVGHLSYLTTAKNLLFLTGLGGNEIAKTPLQLTFVPAGSDAGLLPDEAVFPPSVLGGAWNGRSADFALHLDEYLSAAQIDHEYCHSAPQCVVAGYIGLNFTARHGERARLACEITYLDDRGATRFRIHHITMEKLSHEDWPQKPGLVDEIVERAAADYLNGLIVSLERR